VTSTGQRLVHDVEGLNTGTWPVPTGQFITPIEQFFTRSHAPVPDIDPRSWRLEVGGLVHQPGTFSLEQLDALPRHEVTATVVCAGLRRDEFLSLGPLPGELPWGPEPVGTGRWSGVRLRDILDQVGAAPGSRYVELVGLDQVERHGHRFGFGGSIDLAKAQSGEVLLATRLNGVPLPTVHGFPVRAIVPGWIGARSVKWLGRIALLEEPSSNYFQSQAYRVQRQMDPRDPRDVSAGVALGTVPLNAVILAPLSDQVLPAGLVRMRGWAMGSGGSAVSAVEISPDSGVNWMRARISMAGGAWTWTLWEADVELTSGLHTLAVRATDSIGTTQSPSVTDTWNVKGYANNAWHRVAIRVA
jgi:sulfite oxidase